MAKLIKSDNGYWIGKELKKGSSYSNTDGYTEIDSKKVKVPKYDELILDIESNLKILFCHNYHPSIVKTLAKELCHFRNGMIYCIDYESKFGVRKIYK